MSHLVVHKYIYKQKLLNATLACIGWRLMLIRSIPQVPEIIGKLYLKYLFITGRSTFHLTAVMGKQLMHTLETFSLATSEIHIRKTS